jgi:hypothetical protein
MDFSTVFKIKIKDIVKSVCTVALKPYKQKHSDKKY